MTAPISAENRRRLVLVGILAVFAGGVYYTYVLKPLLRAVSEVGATVRTATAQLREIEQGLIQEPRLHQQRHELAERIAQWQTRIPPAEGLAAVIERLTDLAAQTGVKIQLISPQRAGPATVRPSASAPFYKEIPIQIDAIAGFHQLGVFLGRIELADQPMQLRSLRINEHPTLLRRHLVKMTLVTYTGPPTRNASDGG